MHVLTCLRDQSIMIGDTIEVTIVEIKGNSVRIGINAPRNVAVDRTEIAEQKQRAREADKY